MSRGRKPPKSSAKRKTASGKSPASGEAELQPLYAALQQGRAAQVEQEVAQRLRQRPHDVALLRVLALARMLRQRMAAAIEPLQEATRLDPGHAETWSRLGYACDAIGHIAEAEPAHARAVELAPDQLPFRLNAIANANRLGHYDRAEALARAGLTRTPNHPELLAALGGNLIAAGRTPAACEVLAQACSRHPRHPQLAGNLATALDKTGHPAAAIDRLQQLVNAGALDPPRLQQLLELLLRERRTADAEAVLTALDTPAWRADPSYSHNLGHVRERQGDLDGARSAYREALRQDPNRISAMASWLLITPVAPDDPEVQRLQALYKGSRDADLEQARARAGHLLAKAYWDHGDTEAAMACYHEANRLMATHFARQRQPMATGPCAQFGPALLADTIPHAPTPDTSPAAGDERPVFILGMPRSGKTLIESMLGHHPHVARTDEDRSLMVLIHRLLDDWLVELPEPDGVKAALAGFDTDKLEQLRQDYLAGIARFDPAARRLTQTLPFYLPFVGVIHRLFPRARFIFCRRDPADLGLACYGKEFASAGLMYASDLYALGQEIRATEQIMAHWQAVLPAGRALTVDYEDVVRTPGATAQRLWTHLGVDPDQGKVATDANVPASTSTFALTGSEPGAPQTAFVGIADRVRDHLTALHDGYTAGPDS